ncbi:hypothetical protein L596_022609 [Steinernema carpocapsae]|uniref:Uncharacterized protein n=1 Tax=Steinernema carpocapsae TaxID=34508 RepID=A0A4U5MMA8_STECR|nr:hypothetical protein L596_022609 [Steinernema carpocapsae]
MDLVPRVFVEDVKAYLDSLELDCQMPKLSSRWSMARRSLKNGICALHITSDRGDLYFRCDLSLPNVLEADFEIVSINVGHGSREEARICHPLTKEVLKALKMVLRKSSCRVRFEIASFDVLPKDVEELLLAANRLSRIDCNQVYPQNLDKVILKAIETFTLEELYTCSIDLNEELVTGFEFWIQCRNFEAIWMKVYSNKRDHVCKLAKLMHDYVDREQPFVHNREEVEVETRQSARKVLIHMTARRTTCETL